ncbi:protein mono-ADP-ribosyltransferase PARP15 isoform X1 [Cebus imitator]|uniref:protein mono-ADP-ribosyltransferase PARP15 isoform X1 n=1 Tax=Cebus imitator TaxID=2715852 RepID=UPI00080A04A5|nr:protein mono-ADP-ribosyltransferase PARP15 isoform X1 [Cebus imitator]
MFPRLFLNSWAQVILPPKFWDYRPEPCTWPKGSLEIGIAGNALLFSPQSRDEFSKKDYFSIRNVLASIQTKEGLNLKLISGDVLYIWADVIVNTVPMNLQLGGGSLSWAILHKAGPMLQKELDATRQEAEEKVGSIFMTSGCNLDCKAVLHVVAPGWDNGAGTSWQIMANIIKKSLTTVDQLSFSSITFPLIGTGNLQFPKAVFAKLILSEVFKYSSRARPKTLQEVHFLVHADDDEGYQAFLDEFTKWSRRNPNKARIPMAGDTQGTFGTVSNPWFTAYEMKIGAITFQVATGDITEEKVDVIVNSTTRTFSLKSGVSKAILEGAGPAVENECAMLAAQPHGDFIITQGGGLTCEIIIHVLGENDVRRTVTSVLEECEQRKYTSVSLPAIGTGNARKNPITVADNIIDAIVDFSRKHSTPSLKTVKVVLFLPELLNIFYDSMRKRDTTASPTFQSTFSTTTYNLPEHWTDMNHQLSCMVQLHPGQSEYNTIKDKFTQTCSSYTIEKIERIQNAFLWQSYQVKKKHMDIKNGHTNNERLLFHGTDADSVPHVNQHGFNRSYAGKNAVAYGKGTYFAVDASYSAKDTYSRPDSNGRKHMYVVRVLTGVYTQGHAELVAPPPKNPHSATDLFDSVTDDTLYPRLFVVFFDNQAYPEYLITFRC